MASLKNHPGMWLRDDAAAAINALEDKYGVIIINSAGRTVEQQRDLIRRYDAGEPGIYIPARPPETSTHVRDGGIAVDVYNYTSDRQKLAEFGFEWYGPSDRVHYTFRGWTPPRPAASPLPSPLLGSDNEMIWIARVRQAFYLVVPQGGGKPRAVQLGSVGYTPTEPYAKIPQINFEDDWSIDRLKAAVDGI